MTVDEAIDALTQMSQKGHGDRQLSREVTGFDDRTDLISVDSIDLDRSGQVVIS